MNRDIIADVERNARQAADEKRGIDTCPHPECSAGEYIWRQAYLARAEANARLDELMAGIL